MAAGRRVILAGLVGLLAALASAAPVLAAACAAACDAAFVHADQHACCETPPEPAPCDSDCTFMPAVERASEPFVPSPPTVADAPPAASFSYELPEPATTPAAVHLAARPPPRPVTLVSLACRMND